LCIANEKERRASSKIVSTVKVSSVKLKLEKFEKLKLQSVKLKLEKFKAKSLKS